MGDARGLQGKETAAAEAASRPVLSQANGPYIKWVPERPSCPEAEHELGEDSSRCGSWTLGCLGRDTAGRLVVGFGSVTLPAMVALHRIVVCALAVGLLDDLAGKLLVVVVRVRRQLLHMRLRRR